MKFTKSFQTRFQTITEMETTFLWKIGREKETFRYEHFVFSKIDFKNA